VQFLPAVIRASPPDFGKPLRSTEKAKKHRVFSPSLREVRPPGSQAISFFMEMACKRIRPWYLKGRVITQSEYSCYSISYIKYNFLNKKAFKLRLLASQKNLLSAKEEIHYRWVDQTHSSVQLSWFITRGMGPAVPVDS